MFLLMLKKPTGVIAVCGKMCSILSRWCEYLDLLLNLPTPLPTFERFLLLCHKNYDICHNATITA